MPSMLNPNLVFHERCANKLCTMSWHIFLCTMSRHLSLSLYPYFFIALLLYFIRCA